MAIRTATFYEKPSLTVARALLGDRLVREHPEDGRLVGRIVETEAYTQNDPAFHGWGLYDPDTGTVRCEGKAADLFEEPGRGYVYLIYGAHWLLNIVTEPDGTGGAVLIRAVEPLEGIDAMWRRRGSKRRDADLTNGPGKLTEAFGIDDAFHQADLTGPPLCVEQGKAVSDDAVATSSRIGLTKGVERPWRFYIEDSSYVSPAIPSAKKQ